MTRRLMLLVALATLICMAGTIALLWNTQPIPPSRYQPPAIGERTFFPARTAGGRLLAIEAATDVSLMRSAITAFQREHRDVAVLYSDMQSIELLNRARDACARRGAMPDMYLSISTDHLVELANAGCAARLPAAVANLAPRWARWRQEVIAFGVEPAVFVYNARRWPHDVPVPRSRLALIEALRANPAIWSGRIGTYDIEQSGIGYNFAYLDSRQAATYGRLIESFGRSHVRTYCCSDAMVDAVARGDILLAYNVQLSYALAGKRARRPIGIVVPTDYRTEQPRSVMAARDARNPDDTAAFVRLLLTRDGRGAADATLLSTGEESPAPGAGPDGDAVRPVVDASLLAMRDHARQARFIAEWRRAIRPLATGDPGPPPGP